MVKRAELPRAKSHIDLPNAAFHTVTIGLFVLVFLLCAYPFYYVFIVSISDPQLVQKSTVGALPLGATLGNYRQIFQLPGLWNATLVSIFRTVAGTILTLFMTSMLAYTLTKPQLVARKFFYRYTVVSMYVSAGLIPWYLTMISLGLKNSFWVYILPYAVSAYRMILIKTYIEQMPQALEESAMIDGAGYFTIYARIVMPVCVPVLAASAVFFAVNQWNQWTDNLLLVNDRNLKTLQMILLDYLNQADTIAREASGGYNSGSASITPLTIRMTITMVVTLPIILVYPFMQRFFISGIMIGAVKG